MATQSPDESDRRRVERRFNNRLADLTLPELRRMLVTTTLAIIVVVLFLWMVRTVIIATILGIIVAVYTRPVYNRLRSALGSTAAATITLLGVIVPVFGLLIYSYSEISDVAGYVSAHQEEIALKINTALRKLLYLSRFDLAESIRQYVLAASDYGTRVPGIVKAALKGFAIAATIFIFTTFYVLVDAETITSYLRSKIPPRYSELAAALESNVRGVLYGALYSTFVTQALKSAILFVLFVVFGVKLAGVLMILSFIIGFFPIVGSWSIYVPVAGWLLIFGHNTTGAVIVLLVGFFVNTLFISTYLRPKLAAERSGVLNFYWMLVGLITGVYTFGLAGILLGPILIGLLKGVIDTVSTRGLWQRMDDAEMLAEAEAGQG